MREYASHVVLDAAFTPEECDTLVELGAALETAEGQLAGDDAADDELRRSRVAWIGRDRDTDWAYGRLLELAEQANDERWGFDLGGFEEDLQFTLYDRPGAFYTWHQDGLDGDVATRKMALVVQLTDPEDYEGADLEVFDVVADWDAESLDEWRRRIRQRGTAVAFPAFEYHRVTPLVRGRRASLVAWVSGPPFR